MPPSLALTIARVDCQSPSTGKCVFYLQLQNLGPDTVLINQRLSVGYPSDLNREIFFQVKEAKQHRLTGQRTQLYERHPPAAEDFGWLAAQDSLSVQVNLFEWWEVPAGTYQIKFFYVGNSAQMDFPAQLFRDTLVTDWYPFSVP